MKNKIKWQFTTYYGWLINGIVMMVVGLTMVRDGVLGEAIRNPTNYNNFDMWFWIGITGTAIIGGIIAWFIINAWIVNPIKNAKKKD